MPVETALWRIQEGSLIEAQPSALPSESDLHKWIENDPRLVSNDLLIIGSEVRTGYGGRIDLLGVDSAGTVYIVELKRDKTPRDVVAQALDYASWVVTLAYEDLDEICKSYRSVDLAASFQTQFSEPIPETLNNEHSIMIVASSLDSSSERIVQYLSEQHGLNINAVFFTVFGDESGRYLTRSWLIDPEQVTALSEARTEGKAKGPWTGYYFVNVGVSKTTNRSWEDARKFGFVSAGQGPRFRAYMQKLSPGDKIFAYVKGRGYVGYGVVTAAAVMAKDFVTAGGQRLFDLDLEGTDLMKNPDSEDLAEYVVGVNWKKTVGVDQAKSKKGIFSIQQVVNKIYDASTIDFLIQQFGLSESEL